MTPGLRDVTSAAQGLVAQGDLAGAQDLLDEALSTADPSPAHASPDLTEVAGLQARVLVALGDPHAARGWATFAYSAATRLYGSTDPRTVGAAATLAAVLHRVGSHDRAARLYRDVVIELTAIEGPESLRVLAAHADLATVEYALGECDVARTRLTDAWELHREVYGDGHPSGIKMLARLAGMERDCGRYVVAHQHFALAGELCRQHLPPEDPLARQVDALARAAVDPDHVCSAASSAATDHPTPADHPTPTHHPAPTDLPTPREPSVPERAEPADRDDAYWAAPRHPMATEPAPDDAYQNDPYQDDPYPSLREDPVEPAERWWPPEEGVRSEPDTPTTAPAVHPPDGPASEDPDVTRPYVTRYGTGPDDGRYRAPDTAPRSDPARSDPAYGPARSDPAYGPPPWYRPAQPDDESEAEGVYPVRNLPELRQGSRLPVPVYHPPPRRTSRTVPIVIIGVLVVLLGTAAVIAGFNLTGGGSPTGSTGVPTAAPTGDSAAPPASPAPTVAATSAAPASPGTPPGPVKLRDNSDSVTLTWTYPPGVEGPVVIAGGRRGQQPQAFQDLPAGSNAFTVYGLNKNLDYCFTVGVVYSADVVGTTKPVCTDRKPSPAR
ncbi:tetratricopeptide repeat protein [Plantactinospora sp. GCM10030261]|uniref:tetratricopeptide repeat protein n=1 Tax=Plantactinospora sp. GCM10030261 TaxID=3273420 RepID=UPI003614F9AB